jgi:hypothetical protein
MLVAQPDSPDVLPGAKIGAVRVPVYVPSFAWSGITFEVSVGDAVSWTLAVTDDIFLPEHLLDAAEVEARPFDDPLPSLDYYPTLVRRGSFVAWWDADRPVAGRVMLKAPCSMHDSRLPSEDVPTANGTILQLHWALDHLRQRSDGVWGDIVRGIGLVEVPSTDYEPDQPSFKAYFPTSDIPELTGRWRHIGWIATLECQEDEQLSS